MQIIAANLFKHLITLLNKRLRDFNGEPKTAVLKNGLITLLKLAPSDARNSPQLFQAEKTLLSPVTFQHSYLPVFA